MAVLAILALFTALGGSQTASAGEPEAPGCAEITVGELHDVLIATMKIPGLGGYGTRLEMLNPVVRRAYDFPTVARLVLGRPQWAGLGEEARERFLEVFSRYVVANYAAEFDSFSGHQFRTDAIAELSPGVFNVRASLKTGSGEIHRFDYQIREQDGVCLIINVAVDGVSDLALKRAQYDAVIKRDGFEALLATLEEKIRGFARGEKDDD